VLRYSVFDQVSNGIDPVRISGWTRRFADASTLDFESIAGISLFYPWKDRSKDQRLRTGVSTRKLGLDFPKAVLSEAFFLHDDTRFRRHISGY